MNFITRVINTIVVALAVDVILSIANDRKPAIVKLAEKFDQKFNQTGVEVA